MSQGKNAQNARIKIAILGAGNMGTALAQALASQGHTITIWDIHPEVLSEIKRERRNSRFLPGISLAPEILTSDTPEQCVRDARLVILCIPSAFIADLVSPLIPILEPNAIFLNVSKGFAPNTTVPVPIHLQQLAGHHPVVHLAGPAIANEFVGGKTAFLVMASRSESVAEQVSSWFAGPIFSSSNSSDLMGASLGGILKNIYAILLGAVSEMKTDLSPNHEAAIVTACIQEMVTISVTLGGESQTLYGLAGLGDLLATGYSSDSHNRHLGKSLAAGKSLLTLEKETENLPEGAKATAIALSIARRYQLSLPLAKWVDDLLHGRSPTLIDLMQSLAR